MPQTVHVLPVDDLPVFDASTGPKRKPPRGITKQRRSTP